MAQEGLARAQQRGGRDRMERTGDGFHERVNEAFGKFTGEDWQKAHQELECRVEERTRELTRANAALNGVMMASLANGGTADNILVLEDGVVIGRGTHDELIRDCPTYAEIVQSQIGEKSAA